MMSTDSDEMHINEGSSSTLEFPTSFISADKGSASAGDNSWRLLPRAGEELTSRRSLINRFWQRNGSESTATVIYENICESCHYGIFDGDGRYCSFCKYLLNGQIEDQTEPIYENIGLECAGASIVESEECLPNTETNKIETPATGKKSGGGLLSTGSIQNCPSKSARSGWRHGVLRDLFGSLRKARSRGAKANLDANKRRKLEIIHNVNRVELFGEERNEWRSGNWSPIEADRSVGVDCLRYNKHKGQHIYGKLRKSDDQLMNSFSVERETLHGKQSNGRRTSQSDSNISSIGLRLGGSIAVAPIDHCTVLDENKCDSAKALFGSPAPSRSRVNSFFMIQDNVVDWLTSLRRQTHDYCSYSSPDDSFSSIKSIPSAHFNCCGLLCGSAFTAEEVNSAIVTATSVYSPWLQREAGAAVGTVSANLEENCLDDESLKSLFVVGSSTLRVDLMVDNFKRHLMEKRIRSKRRAIYVKVDEGDECAADTRAAVVSNTGLANVGDERAKRNAFHERNSEFVNDILTAFNTFLSRESESDGNSDGGAHAASFDCNTFPIAKCLSEVHSDSKDLRVPVRSRSQSFSGTCQAINKGNEQIGPVIASLVIAENQSGLRSRRQCKLEIFQSIFHRTDVIIRPSNLRHLVTAIELSKSLNRCLLTVDSILYHFLSVVCSDPRFLKLDRKKLIDMFTTAAEAITATSTSASTKKVHPSDPKSASTSVDKGEPNSDKSDVKNVYACREDDEDIYQPIWKFRSVGNPRESYHSVEPADEITTPQGSGCSSAAPNDSSSLSVEDLSDWETDDEFIFSVNHSSPRNRLLSHQQQLGKTYLKANKGRSNGSPASSPRLGERIRALKTSLLKPPSSSQSLASISSTFSADSAISSSTCNSNFSPYMKRSRATKRKYQRVCILYSYEDPRLRAIVYNNENYRRDQLTSQYDEKKYSNNNYSNRNKSNRASTPFTASVSERLEANNDQAECTQIISKGGSKSSSTSQDFIPLCVQAWKFLLLDTNYLDDEEDIYVTRHEMLNPHRENESPPNTLKKCASEGNLLQLPPDKKKTLGERFMNKVQAVGIFPISPRQMKDKKKLDYLKRRGSVGPYIPSSGNKQLLFGGSLEEVRLSGIMNVPEFVVDCINIIEQPEYICTDGLYRASGNKVEMDLVKKSLTDKYDAKILENQDIHTITGLLKLFFRELKTALISDDVYNKLPDNLVDKENLSCIKDVLYLMSCVSRDTLKYLIKHLTKVAAESHTNRMPASNLAIIWGPCILYSSFTNPMSIARINTLTKVLIEQYDIIFNEKDERLIM